jgi:SAM-dependent methyltransferase
VGLGAWWARLAVEPAYRASKLLSRRGLYPFLEGQASRLPAGAKVLSVGAGGRVGGLLERWSRTTGFELVQLDVDAGRSPDIVADVCRWRAEEAFDAVFASEVLEHLSRPADAVDNLLASLRPGGLLVLTVPFTFPIHQVPHDHFRYTRHGLEGLLAPCSRLTVTERNSWAEALAVLLARTSTAQENRLKAISPLLVACAFALWPLAWLMGRLFPSSLFTTGYLVVGRR